MQSVLRFAPTTETYSRPPNNSHNLGSNAGGLYKGVYLSRTCDMINKDTGEPFRGRDFYVGSIAKLRSVSLEVCTGRGSAQGRFFLFSVRGERRVSLALWGGDSFIASLHRIHEEERGALVARS